MVLLPSGAKVHGWLNGHEVKFQHGTPAADGRALSPASAAISLKPGKNEVLLKVTGSDDAALAVVTTLVSPQGVELPH